MALKLGELLLREKMITREQLDEALKNQMIYGIRLGSSLIEMGYVEEGALARLLSSKLGVPSVGRKDLASIPRDILGLVSRELVLKYQVIPFKLEGNRLSIAMADPTDFRAVEEIGFVTGRVVQPFIAPDVHISRALAKYFHSSAADLRYQQVAALAQKKKAAVKPDKPATITIPGFSEGGELLNVTVPAEFEGFASLSDEPPDDPYLPGDPEKYTVDRVSLDFAAARSRDDVADVFIRYLGQEFVIGALCIIRGASATGWRAIHKGEKIADFPGLNVLLSKPSVLRDIVETRTFAMGSLVNTPENRQVLAALGTEPTTPLLVLPVVMLNKVVAAVLVSAEMESLGRRLQELQKLVYKASLAFEMLIIKNKILMT